MVGEASSPRCLERLRGLRARWCLRGLEWVLERSPGRHLGAFWSPGRALWDLWEPLGSLLEPLGGFLEPLGGLLGVIWVILEAAGRILGPPGALLGPLGRILGGSWEHFGGIWGRILSYFGAWEASSTRFAEILKNLEKHCKVLQKSRLGESESMVN